MADKNNYYKVIQITDTHLFKDNSTLMDVNTLHNFDQVIDKIQLDELSDLDAIFLTGDLSQDESLPSYQLIVDRISKLGKPVYWIAGNHDCIEDMQTAFSTCSTFNPGTHLTIPNWEFVFVNSKYENSDKGYISDKELSRLDMQLKNQKNKNIAIVMHHHPIEVGTPLIDEYILINQESFWNVVSRHHVNLVICGHVHGDYHLKYGKTDIHTAPATCLQWKVGTSTKVIDNKIGYKIYYFKEDGYEHKTKTWVF